MKRRVLEWLLKAIHVHRYKPCCEPKLVKHVRGFHVVHRHVVCACGAEETWRESFDKAAHVMQRKAMR